MEPPLKSLYCTLSITNYHFTQKKKKKKTQSTILTCENGYKICFVFGFIDY